MTDEKTGIIETAVEAIVRGLKIGGGGVLLYAIYRFFRPYWYAIWIQNWLQEEQDYVKDFSRDLHPLGFYIFDVHLSEGGDPEVVIENRSRRVPVIIRAHRNFDAGTLGSLLERTESEDSNPMFDEQRQFLEEVEFALNSAPGVYWYVDYEGEVCEAREADGVVIEYRIYPDAVSQHEILNSIVEMASALKMVRQREQKYGERLNSGR